VGHEITHGFDELRRHIDKDGKKYTLWSQKTKNMFDKRSKCTIDQYNNYTMSQINLQVSRFVQRFQKSLLFVFVRWMVITHLMKILLTMMD
jgi:predicted metalloendopeptidase